MGDGEPLHILNRNDIVMPPPTIGHLRDAAISLGDYDVGTCNCHHTALHVYNICAKRLVKLEEMPNAGYMKVARALRWVAVDALNFFKNSSTSEMNSAPVYEPSQP